MRDVNIQRLFPIILDLKETTPLVMIGLAAIQY